MNDKRDNTVGAVGNGSEKFNKEQETTVKRILYKIAFESNLPNVGLPVLVSGHSKLEGIDIWAEDVWVHCGLKDFMDIQPPSTEDWEDYLCCTGCASIHKGQTNRASKCECKCHSPVLRDAELNWVTLVGYKSRNLAIARKSRTVHVILSTEYPKDYIGQKFDVCYHCENTKSPWKNIHPFHCKSGACWTALRAHEYGNKVVFYFVAPDGSYKKMMHNA